MLSLERMRAIEIDLATRVAVVEPGAFNAEVKAAAAAHGLWYPPDPSSYEICSIGGNIATNAGGLCCVKYGVTTDYVLGLDVVLADGTLVTLGGKRIKDVAGLSLLKLFVGSEGTLGIVTRAILRLIPAQSVPSTLVASFPTVRGRRGYRRGDRCNAARIDDGTDGLGLDQRGRGLPLDGARPLRGSVADRPVGRARSLLRGGDRDHGGRLRPPRAPSEVFVTDDPDEGELFVAARRAAFPAIEARGSSCWRTSVFRYRSCRSCWRAIAAVAEKYSVEIPVVAHAGDGNTHPIVVFDPNDASARDRAHLAFDEIMHAAIALGGTISGEHGVGRTKKGALPDQLGPDVMALSHKIKNALDPAGILNPERFCKPTLGTPNVTAGAARMLSAARSTVSRIRLVRVSTRLASPTQTRMAALGRARKRVPMLSRRRVRVERGAQVGRLDEILDVVQGGPRPGLLGLLDGGLAGRLHQSGFAQLGHPNLVGPRPAAFRPAAGDQQPGALLVHPLCRAVDPAEAQ